MQIRSVLELLADGDYHSGREIGLCLGVTRAAVWKLLANHLPLGVSVEVRKGVGYRIDGGVDLLNEASIANGLCDVPGWHVTYHQRDIIDSTNSFLMDSVFSVHDNQAHVCAAEMQVAGRGRRGRHWCSPYAKNLYLSIAFHMDGGCDRLSGLSLVAGIAVARALNGLGVADVKLKWPNDLLYKSQKLGGILVELTGSPADGWKVVVGIGLNILMSSGPESVEIDQDWISLCQCAGSPLPPRSEILLVVVRGFFAALNDYKTDGFDFFLDEWGRYDHLRGKSVVLLGKDLAGVALGVGRKGELMIRTESGQIVDVNAG